MPFKLSRLIEENILEFCEKLFVKKKNFKWLKSSFSNDVQYVSKSNKTRLSINVVEPANDKLDNLFRHNRNDSDVWRNILSSLWFKFDNDKWSIPSIDVTFSRSVIPEEDFGEIIIGWMWE